MKNLTFVRWKNPKLHGRPETQTRRIFIVQRRHSQPPARDIRTIGQAGRFFGGSKGLAFPCAASRPHSGSRKFKIQITQIPKKPRCRLQNQQNQFYTHQVYPATTLTDRALELVLTGEVQQARRLHATPLIEVMTLQAMIDTDATEALNTETQLLHAVSALNCGNYALADSLFQITAPLITNPSLRASLLQTRVLVKLRRNLPDKATHLLNQEIADHPQQPDTVLNLAEALIDLSQQPNIASNAHLALCLHLINEGLTGLTYTHLPEAMMTLALQGKSEELQRIITHLPDLGSDQNATLHYATCLHVCGEHEEARRILEECDLSGPSITALRSRLHLAHLQDDREQLQACLIEMQNHGIDNLRRRELRHLAAQLKPHVRKATFPIITLNLLNYAENDIKIKLCSERPSIIVADQQLSLGTLNNTCAQVIALLAWKQRSDEGAMSSDDLGNELFSDQQPEPRKRRQAVAKVIHTLRTKVHRDIIHTTPQDTYTLGNIHIELDTDYIERLISSGKLIAAADLLAQGLLQDTESNYLQQQRTGIYQRLFSAIEQQAVNPECRTGLRQALLAFTPWHWPDAEIESKAEDLARQLNDT